MIRISTFSETGGHVRNEDFFDVRPHPGDPHCTLCALADGQGGRSGGAAAARLACQTCIELCSEYRLAQLSRPGTWPKILRRVDEAVSQDSRAGLTTLVAFCISHQQVFGASNGDSAALLASAAGAGRILTARQAKNPPVGSGNAAFVSFTGRLFSPWKVLAMSDGVWKYAGWETVQEVALETSGQACIDALREKALLPGSGRLQDDFTLVVLEG